MKVSTETDDVRFEIFLRKFAETVGIPRKRLERYIFQNHNWRQDRREHGEPSSTRRKRKAELLHNTSR